MPRTLSAGEERLIFNSTVSERVRLWAVHTLRKQLRIGVSLTMQIMISPISETPLSAMRPDHRVLIATSTAYASSSKRRNKLVLENQVGWIGLLLVCTVPQQYFSEMAVCPVCRTCWNNKSMRVQKGTASRSCVMYILLLPAAQSIAEG
jgi:hypothetical protein